MMHRVGLTGEGRVEVAAYGLADAEHLVEKEIAHLCTGAQVEVVEVARIGQERRIAEEFRVVFRVHWQLEVDAVSAEAARGQAFRRARERLEGTRYYRVEWRYESIRAASGSGEA